MDLYDYLTDNYKRVSELDNGYYYAVDKYENELFIPKNLGSETSLLTYLPGSGGSTNDAVPLRALMRSENPPDYVAVISHGCGDHYNVAEMATAAINAGDSKVSGVVLQSFSASGGVGFVSLGSYIQNHPELKDNCAMVISDGYSFTSERVDSEEAHILAENDVPILLVTPRDNLGRTRGDRENRGFEKQLIEKGYNIYELDTNDGSHCDINADAINNDIASYLFGYKDELGNKGVRKEPDYVALQYNTETHDYVEVSLEDTRLDSALTVEHFMEAPDVSLLYKVNEFEIKEEDCTAVETYKGLKDIPEYTLKSPSEDATYFTDGLASDMNYVVSYMNQIGGQIKSSSFMDGVKVQSFRSSSGIPGCIAGYLNNYFNSVGELLTSLQKQSEAIVSIGQTYLDLDIDLARKAEGLIDEIGTIVEVPEPKPPGGGGYGPSETPEPEEDEYKIVVEDDKVTQKREDNSVVSLEYKDNKVESIKYVYSYETKEAAEEIAKKFKEEYASSKFIKEVVVKDNTVELIFDESLYEKINIEELLKKIKENDSLKLDELIMEYLEGGTK